MRTPAETRNIEGEVRNMYLINLRNRHFFLLDGLILCLTPLLAILLRLDRIDVPHDFLHGLLIYMAVSLVVRLITFINWGCTAVSGSTPALMN